MKRERGTGPPSPRSPLSTFHSKFSLPKNRKLNLRQKLKGQQPRKPTYKRETARFSGRQMTHFGKTDSSTLSKIQPAFGNNQPTLSNNQLALGNNQPALGKYQPTLSKYQLTLSNIKPALDNIQPTLGKIQPTLAEFYPS
jgi:hypothetical protein